MASFETAPRLLRLAVQTQFELLIAKSIRVLFILSTVSLLDGRIRVRIRNCHFAGSAPKRTLQETRQLVSFECGIVLSTQVLEWSLPLGTGQTNFLNRRLLFYHFKPYSIVTLSLQMLHLTKLELKPPRVTAVDGVHQHQ